jgi:hypothetical protein
MECFQCGYEKGEEAACPRCEQQARDRFARIVGMLVLVVEGGILLLLAAGYLSRLFSPNEQRFELLAVGPFSRVRLLYLAALLPRVVGALAFVLRRRWGAGLFLLGALVQAAVLLILTLDEELMYNAVAGPDPPGDSSQIIAAGIGSIIINRFLWVKWVLVNMLPAFWMLRSALGRPV